mgnify:CR=1 FL=1
MTNKSEKTILHLSKLLDESLAESQNKFNLKLQENDRIQRYRLALILLAGFIFIALVSYALSFQLVTLTMAILAILQLISFGLVARFAHNSLRNNFSA